VSVEARVKFASLHPARKTVPKDVQSSSTSYDIFRALFLVSVAIASGAKCGPNVKLSVDGESVTFESGACVPVASDAKAVEFCGPGKLVYSRMTCNNHGYKGVTVEHDKTKYTTQCESIAMEGTVTDGHLGSVSVTC